MEQLFSLIVNNFKSTYTIIEAEILNLIEKIVDINEDIFIYEPLKSFYDKDSMSNIKLVIFSIIFAIAIYKCGKTILYMYKESCLNYMPQIVIKAIIAIIIITNSSYILKELINLNYLFTETIESLFSEILNDEISYESLIKNFDSVEQFFKDRFKVNVKDSSKAISCIILLALLIIFSIRYVIIILFLILFPFLVLFFIFDSHNYIIRKIVIFFLSNLAVQNLNKVILFIPLVSKKEEFYEIVLLGSLFILYKINKLVINIGDIWKR